MFIVCISFLQICAN